MIMKFMMIMKFNFMLTGRDSCGEIQHFWQQQKADFKSNQIP